MPLLDAAQQAVLRTEVHEPSITDEQVVDAYRNRPVSEGGGKSGGPVLFQEGMAVRIRPVGQAASMTRLLQQTFPLSTARISHLGKVATDEDVQQGDEWKQGARRYKVTGVGPWQNAILVSLEEVKQQL
jgi:hypothetical protein